MKRALTIDDSFTVRNLVKMTLEGLGFKVDEASNGKEALSKTETNKYDLVICDINMPVMNGLDFLKEFKKNNRTTPVLMVTTETELAKKQTAKQYGATGWIVKPFNPNDLTKVVKRVVRIWDG